MKKSEEILDRLRSLRSDMIIFTHGGPIATPEGRKYVFEYTKSLDVV